MIKQHKILFALATLFSASVISESYAISKLDFFEPVVDFTEKVQKQEEKIETQFNTYTEGLIEKMKKAVGNEGAALFDVFVIQHGKSIIKNAATGQFNANDFTMKGLINSLSSQLGNYNADRETMLLLLTDYRSALNKEKMAKEDAMKVELAKLEATRKALDNVLQEDGSNQEALAKIDKLDKQISYLKSEVDANATKQIENQQIVKKYESKIRDIDKVIENLTAKTSDANLQKTLNTEIEKLFKTVEKEDDNNNALYGIAINKMFLGKYDQINSTSVNKIMKVRKDEHYKAAKNAFKAIVDTNLSMIDTDDRYQQCTEAATEAEGQFGAEAMNVCVMLQQAKAAAQYMEIILAELRLSTTSEMMSWNDKYKLKNYNHDVTEFNLDDYVLKKQDILSKTKEEFDNAITDKLHNGNWITF
ncbi:MAG: hypothetical protein ILA52_02875 [Alphaproteobacteria bacterium]|nr:hypothetical protein [Alphaproteobacteria bacterium]